MNKKIIIMIFALILITIFYICAKTNKLKIVKNNAIEYITQTYPEFAIIDISVKYEWYPNRYVVNYNDEKGDSRTLIFDHTGENLSIDEYIQNESYSIIYSYENNIRTKIIEELKKELSINASYVIIDDINAYGKERDIVLNGLDVSKDSVACSIGIIGDDSNTTLEFAELAKTIYITVSNLELPIEKIEIHQQNSPDSRYDITCPINTGEMSIEEINKLVTK